MLREGLQGAFFDRVHDLCRREASTAQFTVLLKHMSHIGHHQGAGAQVGAADCPSAHPHGPAGTLAGATSSNEAPNETSALQLYVPDIEVQPSPHHQTPSRLCSQSKSMQGYPLPDSD